MVGMDIFLFSVVVLYDIGGSIGLVVAYSIRCNKVIAP